MTRELSMVSCVIAYVVLVQNVFIVFQNIMYSSQVCEIYIKSIY